VSRWDPEADEIRNRHPYTYGEAKAAIARASRDQDAAAQWATEAADDFAQKEHAYRVALSCEITRQHADGVAWTAAADLARGEKDVARLRMERDVAEGVKSAAEQRSWQAAANRKSLDRLVEWSMRRDLAEFYGGDPS
jgi:chlorite dismutase